MSNDKVNEAIKLVKALTADEFKEFAREVNDYVKESRADNAAEISAKFKKGDKVMFTGRKNMVLTGTIVKKNRIRAKVKVVDTIGRIVNWNVGYGALKKIA